VLEQFRLTPSARIAEVAACIHGSIWTPGRSQTAQGDRDNPRAIVDKLRGLADRAVKRGPPIYRERTDPAVTNSSGSATWAIPCRCRHGLSAQRPATILGQCARVGFGRLRYKTWGLGRIDGMDLAAGHQLFGLGIVYDWSMRNWTRRLADDPRHDPATWLAMFEAALRVRRWGRSYLQNHLWVDACGLAVAGFAVFDEVEDAELWTSALDKFRRTRMRWVRGASHEGRYGNMASILAEFMAISRQRLGVDLSAMTGGSHGPLSAVSRPATICVDSI